MRGLPKQTFHLSQPSPADHDLAVSIRNSSKAVNVSNANYLISLCAKAEVGKTLC